MCKNVIVSKAGYSVDALRQNLEVIRSPRPNVEKYNKKNKSKLKSTIQIVFIQ